MPELPDVMLYLGALRPRIVGRRLERISISSPFLLRSVDPPIEAAQGRTVAAVSRIGKRIVLELDGDLFIIIHLMIAGRFRWKDAPPSGARSAAPAARAPRPAGKITLATLTFPTGDLILTEAGTRKRASLHIVASRAALAPFDRRAVDPLTADAPAFAAALARENRTLKRALTDPRILDGIGNAYSDEILHAARLSPFKLTHALSPQETKRLHAAAQDTLTRWTDRLRHDFGDRFPGPGDVTAFRPDFAVHGRYRKPCPDCATPVQRIIYAENEMNYCPTCQTQGRILADRSLSRLLKSDWPSTVEELEDGRA